jgi:hypothetical protein
MLSQDNGGVIAEDMCNRSFKLLVDASIFEDSLS